MSYFSKLRGTFETLFMLGKAGPNLKNNSGVVEMRNNADGDFAIARADAPVGNDDLVTLQYFNDNNNAATGLTWVKLPLLLATKVSTSAIPDDATIFACILDIETAYDASATWNVLRTGDPTAAPMATGDNDPAVIGTYEVPQITDWGSTGAGTVTATLVNSPTVGAATLYVGYSTPTDIS